MVNISRYNFPCKKSRTENYQKNNFNNERYSQTDKHKQKNILTETYY